MLILERPKHLFKKTEDTIAKIAAILSEIEGKEVNSIAHKDKVKSVYKNWREFIEKAVEFNMLLPLDRIESTNALQYWKTGKVPTVKLVADKRTKVKPKQGNGSVLAPRFNHGISKPEDSKPEIYRTERARTSKLPIIGRLEDARAFDTEYQLERLRSKQR